MAKGAAPSVPPLTARDSEEITVLHVDDDSSFLELSVDCLERADDRLSVVTVSDPSAAIDRCERGRPDCVVSDYDMPRMDGLELYETLQDRGLDVPFILLTGKGSESIAADAISAGVTDYIQKGGLETFDIVANRVTDAVESQQRKVVAEQATSHYRELVENAHLPIYQYDADGLIRYVNGPAVELFGAESSEAVVGSPLFEYHPEDKHQAIQERLEELNCGYPAPATEITFQGDDGCDRVAKVTCAPTPHRPDIAGQTIAHDVTELQERKQELQQFRKVVTTALERVDAGIWSYEPGADTLDRYGVASMLGVDEGEMEPTLDGFLEYVHPDDRDEVKEQYHEAVSQQASFVLRFRALAADGSIRYVEDRTAVITDGDGTVTRLLGVMHDVTKNEQHKQQLSASRDRHEEIASVLSHDLENTVNTLGTRLELAKQSGDTEDHLESATHQVERLTALLDGLTETVRAGKPVTEPEEIDLATAAAEAAETCGFGTDRLTIASNRTVSADPNGLQRLLQNLFVNAHEHNSEPVTVEIGASADGFYVEDTGTGLPDDIGDQIFEFGVSTEAQGTGIGLASVRQVVESHDWEIAATNGERGARFEISVVDGGIS